MRFDQLERHARAADVFVRIATARKRVAQDRFTGGQHIPRQVMIGHNRIHAELPAAQKFRVCLHAVVHRNNQLHALRRKPLHRGKVHAIPLRMAGRDMVGHICAAPAQIHQQHACGAYAIHVIIAVNADALPLCYGARKPCHGLLHLLKSKRIAQHLRARM